VPAHALTISAPTNTTAIQFHRFILFTSLENKPRIFTNVH
jgi:hypothetical protein